MEGNPASLPIPSSLFAIPYSPLPIRHSPAAQ
jgi:hypothetical protein